MHTLKVLFVTALFALMSPANAQTEQRVVDIPTRPGVTQRILVLGPTNPKAAVILFPDGHGGLQLFGNGSMKWGENNFLVRTRQLFSEAGLTVAIVDAPSDRQAPPFLQGFRQSPDHAADVKAVIAWLRQTAKVPAWLVGTSRGTESAAYVTTELGGVDGPDGLVLTSTILKDDKCRSVPAMSLGKIRIPALGGSTGSSLDFGAVAVTTPSFQPTALGGSWTQTPGFSGDNNVVIGCQFLSSTAKPTVNQFLADAEL